MKLLLRWVIIAFSLFVAAWLVPGIRVEGNAWLIYAVMAVILAGSMSAFTWMASGLLSWVRSL
jgi:uncharacterized membrane protein YvlD (DUF360 family)